MNLALFILICIRFIGCIFLVGCFSLLLVLFFLTFCYGALLFNDPRERHQRSGCHHVDVDAVRASGCADPGEGPRHVDGTDDWTGGPTRTTPPRVLHVSVVHSFKKSFDKVKA